MDTLIDWLLGGRLKWPLHACISWRLHFLSRDSIPWWLFFIVTISHHIYLSSSLLHSPPSHYHIVIFIIINAFILLLVHFPAALSCTFSNQLHQLSCALAHFLELYYTNTIPFAIRLFNISLHSNTPIVHRHPIHIRLCHPITACVVHFSSLWCTFSIIPRACYRSVHSYHPFPIPRLSSFIVLHVLTMLSRV